MKRVLDVGQCGMDHGSIRRLIERAFDAEVVQAHDLAGALERLRSGAFDLVLVNRKFDADYSDGLDLIKQIKDDAGLESTPVMLVSNFADAQEQAVAVGAEPGFGKAQLTAPETQACLAKFLG